MISVSRIDFRVLEPTSLELTLVSHGMNSNPDIHRDIGLKLVDGVFDLLYIEPQYLELPQFIQDQTEAFKGIVFINDEFVIGLNRFIPDESARITYMQTLLNKQDMKIETLIRILFHIENGKIGADDENFKKFVSTKITETLPKMTLSQIHSLKERVWHFLPKLRNDIVSVIVNKSPEHVMDALQILNKHMSQDKQKGSNLEKEKIEAKKTLHSIAQLIPQMKGQGADPGWEHKLQELAVKFGMNEVFQVEDRAALFWSAYDHSGTSERGNAFILKQMKKILSKPDLDLRIRHTIFDS